jgi:hypothetical protein
MKNNYIYKYADKISYFILSTKLDVLNSLIDYRLDNLKETELDNTMTKLQSQLSKLNEHTDFEDDTNTEDSIPFEPSKGIRISAGGGGRGIGSNKEDASRQAASTRPRSASAGRAPPKLTGFSNIQGQLR